MTSQALLSLNEAMMEVTELGQLSGIAVGNASGMRAARGLGRARVVLLSSHFERYFYAVNEEAVELLNMCQNTTVSVSNEFRLVHSRQPIDEMGRKEWSNREMSLQDFIENEAWLWTPSANRKPLKHDRLLAWMTSPTPKNLVRYYKYWGIHDMFSRITRKPTTRQRLWLAIQEIVDKRNSIAHGDVLAQATDEDISRYLTSVTTFCERADRLFGRAVGGVLGLRSAW